MAKVTQPLGSSEARGALGGYVYNTWRGIHTVRTRVTPKTLNSDAQLALRALTKSCTLAWQALSNAQRARWYVYANTHLEADWTGVPKRLTSYNWFIRINFRALSVGGSISSIPPTFELVDSVKNLSAIQDTPEIAVFWNPATLPPAGTLFYEVYSTGPLSPARNPTQKDSIRVGYTQKYNGGFSFANSGNGTYHIFVRPVMYTGQVAGWDRTSCTYA